MLFMVFYFCKVDAKVCAVAGFVFLMMLCYFGFVPVPAPPSIEGKLAPIWVLFNSVMLLLIASMLVTGKTEKMYEDQPGGSAKRMMSVGVGTPVYERELLTGITLLGMGFTDISAAITGAAMNFCVMAGPSGFVIGVVHYAIQGDKKNGKTNFAVSVFLHVHRIRCPCNSVNVEKPHHWSPLSQFRPAIWYFLCCIFGGNIEGFRMRNSQE